MTVYKCINNCGVVASSETGHVGETMKDPCIKCGGLMRIAK